MLLSPRLIPALFALAGHISGSPQHGPAMVGAWIPTFSPRRLASPAWLWVLGLLLMAVSSSGALALCGAV